MASDTAGNLSDQQIAEFKDTFNSFDANGDGTISATELGNIMRSLGQNPTEIELQDIIDEADLDRNGAIDFHEFLNLMEGKNAPIGSYREEMKAAFDVFDRDGSGSITEQELKHVMQRLDRNLTDKDIEAMLETADKNGDGTIDFDEFMKLMEVTKE